MFCTYSKLNDNSKLLKIVTKPLKNKYNEVFRVWILEMAITTV